MRNYDVVMLIQVCCRKDIANSELFYLILGNKAYLMLK